MNDFGPPLVAVGIALLLVPVAEAMGALGYFLLGLGFVTVGGMVAFLPDSSGVASDAGEVRAHNCPNCGSPADPEEKTCEYCGARL